MDVPEAVSVTIRPSIPTLADQCLPSHVLFQGLLCIQTEEPRQSILWLIIWSLSYLAFKIEATIFGGAAVIWVNMDPSVLEGSSLHPQRPNSTEISSSNHPKQKEMSRSKFSTQATLRVGPLNRQVLKTPNLSKYCLRHTLVISQIVQVERQGNVSVGRKGIE